MREGDTVASRGGRESQESDCLRTAGGCRRHEGPPVDVVCNRLVCRSNMRTAVCHGTDRVYNSGDRGVCSSVCIVRPACRLTAKPAFEPRRDVDRCRSHTTLGISW